MLTNEAIYSGSFHMNVIKCNSINGKTVPGIKIHLVNKKGYIFFYNQLFAILGKYIMS